MNGTQKPLLPKIAQPELARERQLDIDVEASSRAERLRTRIHDSCAITEAQRFIDGETLA
jgi:hypothetical protein